LSLGALLICAYIFLMACFTGIELISRVPTTLHTPLMSGSNAISGITIVGALTAISAETSQGIMIIAFMGLVFASINVFGGYTVTDRMLKMFGKKK